MKAPCYLRSPCYLANLRTMCMFLKGVFSPNPPFRARRFCRRRSPCSCCAAARARRCCCRRSPCTRCASARACRGRCRRSPCTCCALARARRGRYRRTPCTGCAAARARTSCVPSCPRSFGTKLELACLKKNGTGTGQLGFILLRLSVFFIVGAVVPLSAFFSRRSFLGFGPDYLVKSIKVGQITWFSRKRGQITWICKTVGQITWGFRFA